MNTPAANYNPDVLSCLANLSNDEVFTPPDVVNSMLDMLPDSLWKNPDAKFLDPCCKTGVFLREIVKRLNAGLTTLSEYEGEKNLQKRLDHIFETQLYGIAITELTSLLSRRSVYCSKTANGKYSVTKFDSENGNIFFDDCAHTWVDGKCTYCGASESEYGERENLENHAYQFIHNATPEEISKMKFDVVIGNPPYQMSDGGNAASARPIYQLFVEEAKKINPRYLIMIIPSRWYAGGKGLDDFRDKMLHDTRLCNLIDYPNSNDCFPGVSIKGGICYFLWNRDTHGTCKIITMKNNSPVSTSDRNLLENGSDVFIRYNEAIPILRKTQALNEKTFEALVSSRKPFGFSTDFDDYSYKQNSDEIKIYANKEEGYISPQKILQNKAWINKYKILISRAYGAGENFPHQILNKPILAEKNTCCTETYLVIGPFEEKNICTSVLSYIKTRFFRFMVMLKKNTQDATKKVYSFVPLQDFSEKSDIDWSKSVDNIDHQLYKKYNLTPEEILFIESMIRPMDTSSQGNAHV